MWSKNLLSDYSSQEALEDIGFTKGINNAQEVCTGIFEKLNDTFPLYVEEMWP